MTEPDLEWVIFPFAGEFAERVAVPTMSAGLFGGKASELDHLVGSHAFASEALRADAETRCARLVERATGGGIDYLGEGPYPAHWRMDANRGVFHYAGRSAWCFDAYRLFLDLAIRDPAPPGWATHFPRPDAGAIDAGGTLWDFFGDISNEGAHFDTYMAKLFDSFPVWLSPPESHFTGFLNEKDVAKVHAAIAKLGDGRRARSFYLRTFYEYLEHASRLKTGLTAAAIPTGTDWKDEQPKRLEEHW